jgi:hypothetical protein
MGQIDLFAGSTNIAPQSEEPNPQRIRMHLGGALAELRCAEAMPWPDSRLRTWGHLFNNMTKWLPAEERKNLIDEFNRHVERLRGELPLTSRPAA